MACPYGKAGDRLWVKETCFPVHKWKHVPLFAAVVPAWLFRADYDYRKGSVIGCHKWTPSIFMPRTASRILLEVVTVRVERLNKTSENDARNEGGPSILGYKEGKTQHGWATYRAWYKDLWESINGPGSWKKNPWVWVVEFRRVTA